MNEITTDEAARILDVHPHHVCHLIRSGSVEARRWGKAAWMVSLESVQAFARDGRRPGRGRRRKVAASV